MASLKAYILIRIEPDCSRQVLEALRKLENVISVDLVTGPYDAIVVVQAADMNEIAELVVEKVNRISGIASAITCQATKSFNQLATE